MTISAHTPRLSLNTGAKDVLTLTEEVYSDSGIELRVLPKTEPTVARQQLSQELQRLRAGNKRLSDKQRQLSQYTRRLQTDRDHFRKQSQRLLQRCDELEKKTKIQITSRSNVADNVHSTYIRASKIFLSTLKVSNKATKEVQETCQAVNKNSLSTLSASKYVDTAKIYFANFMIKIKSNYENKQMQTRIAKANKNLLKAKQERVKLMKKHGLFPQQKPQASDHLWFGEIR